MSVSTAAPALPQLTWGRGQGNHQVIQKAFPAPEGGPLEALTLLSDKQTFT